MIILQMSAIFILHCSQISGILLLILIILFLNFQFASSSQNPLLPTFSPHLPILTHILETQTKVTYQIIVLCYRNMYYRNIVHSKSNI